MDLVLDEFNINTSPWRTKCLHKIKISKQVERNKKGTAEQWLP